MCQIIDDDDHAERPFAHQINQSFDSANLSSALYHMTMAKRLMVEKTKSELENHEVPTMVSTKELFLVISYITGILSQSSRFFL